MSWRLRSIAVALVLCGVACARTPVARLSSTAPVTVEVIAVGHGDAILITTLAKKSVLIDGGEAEAAPAVLDTLHRRGACPLDLVLLTHRHADHLGGLAKVIEGCGARLFMDGGAAHPSAQYDHLLKVIEDRRVPFRQAMAGRSIDLGAGATLSLLGPPEPLLEAGGVEVNGNSVVSRLVVGKTSMLLTGDAEEHEEAWLLAGQPGLRSTVLKLGHHGSRTSSTAAFLDAVAPDLAVVSCKPGDAKHPHPETLKRLARNHTRLVRTSDEGTIVLGFYGDRVSLESPAHPERIWIP